LINNKGKLEIAKHLLNNGAHIEVADNYGQSTPLLNSIKEGHIELAEILIREYKANCNHRDGKLQSFYIYNYIFIIILIIKIYYISL
jgi:hypothetical protein